MFSRSGSLQAATSGDLKVAATNTGRRGSLKAYLEFSFYNLRCKYGETSNLFNRGLNPGKPRV